MVQWAQADLARGNAIIANPLWSARLANCDRSFTQDLARLLKDDPDKELRQWGGRTGRLGNFLVVDVLPGGGVAGNAMPFRGYSCWDKVFPTMEKVFLKPG